jgi:hypothetical protein
MNSTTTKYMMTIAAKSPAINITFNSFFESSLIAKKHSKTGTPTNIIDVRIATEKIKK